MSSRNPSRGTAISWPHFSHVCTRPVSGYSISQHGSCLVTHSTELQEEAKSHNEDMTHGAKAGATPRANGRAPKGRNGRLAAATSTLPRRSLRASNSLYLQHALQTPRIKEASVHGTVKAAAPGDASCSSFKDLREIQLAQEESVSVVSGEQQSKWGSAPRLWQ